MNEASSPQTVRLWLCDGSPVPFTDIVTLPAAHPGLLGGPVHFKGAIDEAVPVGTSIIDADSAQDVFFPEAEWVLTFADSIEAYSTNPERVNLSTPVIMQGLVEGKWLNRLAGGLSWLPASMANSLLAAGPGILTTLGAIESGEQGEAVVSYQYSVGGRKRTRVQRTTLSDLRGHNILGLVRAVLAHCRENGQSIDGIDLSAMGTAAAIVNEPQWVQAALHATSLTPADLTTPAALQKLVAEMVRAIICTGIGTPPGNSVTIAVSDQRKAIVGKGTLVWRAVGSE